MLIRNGIHAAPAMLCDNKYRSCYFSTMTPYAKKLFDRVASWPNEDVAELDDLAREIEARRSGICVIGDAEWADLQDGFRQVDRKEFVADNAIADKRYT